ncbi:hypothetical protein [Gorillibacterium timonense]|uniref:hypothetical protein n=1 Tax=Gorillibacterium timonense TaxID=1689269 RepID=UPI00071C366C|nr:hypothetical protein [Gorillibacterium timonense]
MTPPKKPPVPREITYRIGRKTGKIQVPSEAPSVKISAVDQQNDESVRGREKGGRIARFARLCWKEAPLPSSTFLLGLVLAAPVLTAAFTAALLYMLRK